MAISQDELLKMLGLVKQQPTAVPKGMEGVGVHYESLGDPWKALASMPGLSTQQAIALGQLKAQSGDTTKQAYVPPTPSVDFTEALQRARDVLDPLYDQSRRSMTRDIQRDFISRGMFGQPDSGGIAAQRLAPLEASRVSDIAKLAQSIEQTAKEQAMRQQETAFGQQMAQQQFGLQESQLSRQREQDKIQNIMNALNLQRQMTESEAGLTGMYQGQPTWERQYQEQQLNLERTRAAQEADYKAWLQSKGISEQQGQIATSGYISQILGFDNPDVAFQYLNQNATAIANDGADINAVLSALKAKWPNYYRGSLVERALSLAQNDWNFMVADTPQERLEILNSYINMLTSLE